MLQRLGRGRAGEDAPVADSAPITDRDGAARAAAVGDGPGAAGGDGAALVTRVRRRMGAQAEPPAAQSGGAREDDGSGPDPGFDLQPHDPLHAYLLGEAGPVDISRLELDSPALAALRAAGVAMVVPLVTQGELIGLLNLGPRLSEPGLLGRRPAAARARSPAQAAPAMRVGQLVRQQEVEARNRERIEQELQVAQLIQQHFLPKQRARPAELACGGLLPPGPHRRRRLLRLHRRSPTAG